MNKEQVYNILSKRAAQQSYAPVRQSSQYDPVAQFNRRVFRSPVPGLKNAEDIWRQHRKNYSSVTPSATTGQQPAAKPMANKDTSKNDPPKPQDKNKPPKKPGTPDPWSSWGGKLVGGGIGALGLYGLSKLFGASGILALLATVVGAGIGGYFGHSYDAAIAKKQPAPETPAPTTTK